MSGVDVCHLPRPFVLKDGTRVLPGLVDRNTYLEIPDEAFWFEPRLSRGDVVVAEMRGQDVGLALMQGENARLRALIKSVEFNTAHHDYCPWCHSQGVRRAPEYEVLEMTHAADCAAFTVDGVVR